MRWPARQSRRRAIAARTPRPGPAPASGDYRACDRGVARVLRQPLHEGAVELQRVDGQALQLREAGVAERRCEHDRREIERLLAARVIKAIDGCDGVLGAYPRSPA
jgi:hypothetical protein